MPRSTIASAPNEAATFPSLRARAAAEVIEPMENPDVLESSSTEE